ncbi:hypothetical protein [Paenibacillus hexagrammi]|uniref:Uncharacterized protein n=1 Tax=Paenibacillus hexagrammi TaxID=2908839 RepID=A0ABY3SD20_9BACL|nr:hypothetical protein [Paenibacillus sp. YPD9-1]UJF31889.1 hypothetical protein L0M14_19290 [Paenibacillus sp. YPD9-1]
MNITNLRLIAFSTCIFAVFLFIIDGLYIHNGQQFDGMGLISTFILPPIGIISVIAARKRSGSILDKMLIVMNLAAFFSFLFSCL